MIGEDRVTLAEAAALLGYHMNTVRTRVKAGQYPSEKVLTKKGEAYLIPRAAIDAERRGEPLPPAGTYTPGAPPLRPSEGNGRSAPHPVIDHTTGGLPIIDQDGRGLIAALPEAVGYDALVLSLREALDPTIAELAHAAEALHDAAQELAVTRGALDRAQADLDTERARRAAIPRPVADPWRQVMRDLGAAAVSLTGRLTPHRQTRR